MKLVVGLGNPGSKYCHTRHNVGFDFIDSYFNFKEVVPSWSNKFNGMIFKTVINSNSVIFLKPQTYMNLSGDSVKKVVDYYQIDIDDILVISDDLDLNLGNFKLKLAGSSGGHNGLKDIENKLHSSLYKRLKIGISNNYKMDTADYVLGHFSSDEEKKLKELFSFLWNVMDDYFILPFNDLMSKYNRKNR